MPPLSFRVIMEYTLFITQESVDEYTKHYFLEHPRAKNPPIKHPYHPSINEWMIMKRMAMNSTKQKWKDFIIWLVGRAGYTNLGIQKCDIEVFTYYKSNNPHDPDNSVPKFILDGMVDSGMIVRDDHKHVLSLKLQCGVDKENPRTEIKIIVR